MKHICLAILLLGSVAGAAQKTTTFEIEKLDPPENLLTEEADTGIYRKLLLQDAKTNAFEATKHNFNPLSSVVSRYKAPDVLVNFGYHSFFDGMYRAYADHRPVILSPDMIWLLIIQGFSQHVNNNAENLRRYFVKHEGRASLVVVNNEIKLDDPESPWQEIFPEFSRQIAAYTGKDLVDVLTADFTTTTPATKIASEITVMDAMKKYFEYIVMVIGCGIPRVTLEGTTADWEKLLKKAQALKKYELDWWIKEIEPYLTEFINASKGKPDRSIWRNFFKYHDVAGVYKSKMIDGWFVKFFPYNRDGKRNNLDSLPGSAVLPDEIVKADLTYVVLDDAGNKVEDVPLELWSGFFGLQQNKADYALRPEIGWLVKRKDAVDQFILTRLEKEKDNLFGVAIRVNTIPPELLKIDRFKRLRITFTDSIQVPDAMGKIQIETLILAGRISEKERERIFKLFPHTNVTINAETRGTPARNKDIKNLPVF